MKKIHFDSASETLMSTSELGAPMETVSYYCPGNRISSIQYRTSSPKHLEYGVCEERPVILLWLAIRYDLEASI